MSEYQEYIKNLSEKLICVLLIVIMLVIPASHYIIWTTENFYTLVQSSIYVCTGGLAIILLLGIMQGGIKFNNKSILLIISSLTTIAVISTITSIDVNISIWGFNGRFEGLILIISYYIIFLSAMAIRENKRVLKLVKIFMFIGVLHCIYGFCQKYDLLNNLVIDKFDGSISGLTGNPNFMGSYTVLLTGLSSAFFYFSKTLKNRLVYFALTLLYLLTMIFTDAMSAVFGTAFMVLFFFIFVFTTMKKYNNQKEKLSSFKVLIVSSVVLVVAFIGLMFYTEGSYIKEIASAFQDVFSSGDSLNEYSGSGRFLVWKESLTLIPSYWLFGSGLDTFGLAYHSVFPVRLAYFDKAHNELLQIIITQGIPALLFYLSLYFVIFKNFVKRLKEKYKNKEGLEYDFLFIGLCIAIIGYITQAVFNISTIGVAPFFWMLLGFLAGFGRKEDKDDFYLK